MEKEFLSIVLNESIQDTRNVTAHAASAIGFASSSSSVARSRDEGSVEVTKLGILRTNFLFTSLEVFGNLLVAY